MKEPELVKDTEILTSEDILKHEEDDWQIL